MSDGGAAFHWGWLVLFVRALAQNDAAPSCFVIGERGSSRNRGYWLVIFVRAKLDSMLSRGIISFVTTI